MLDYSAEFIKLRDHMTNWRVLDAKSNSRPAIPYLKIEARNPVNGQGIQRMGWRITIYHEYNPNKTTYEREDERADVVELLESYGACEINGLPGYLLEVNPNNNVTSLVTRIDFYV